MANNTTSALGLTESTVVVGDDGVVTGQAGTSANRNVTESTATNVGTGTGDTSTASAENTAQVGIYSSPITIGDEGTVNGYEYASVTADASSIEGASTATAEFSGLTGTGSGAVSSTGAIIGTKELISAGVGSSAGTPSTPGTAAAGFVAEGSAADINVGDEIRVGIGAGSNNYTFEYTVAAGDTAIIGTNGGSALASFVVANASSFVDGAVSLNQVADLKVAANDADFAIGSGSGGIPSGAPAALDQYNEWIVFSSKDGSASELSSWQVDSLNVVDTGGNGSYGNKATFTVELNSFVAATGSSSGTPAVYGGNADDIVIGDNGLINAFADNIADADATSVCRQCGCHGNHQGNLRHAQH